MTMLANAERLGWEALAEALAPTTPPPLTGERMKFIRDLIRSKKPAAAALRAALAELPIDGAANDVAEAEAAYRDLLLDGETGQVLTGTRKRIEFLREEQDRVLAYRDELQAQIVIADQREALDALAAKRDAAETEAKAVAGLFTKRYGALVTEVVGLIDRLEAAEAGIAGVNQALSDAGMVDRMQDVESRLKADVFLVAGRRLRLYLGMEGDRTQPAAAQ